MTVFEMVKYHKQIYPANIPLNVEEIAAHFDISKISSTLGYSLHTEYSYGKRKFDSIVISRFPAIIEAQKDGVPQLWKSDLWAEEFSQFIIGLVEEKPYPDIIEVHPPFNDYSSMNRFIETYMIFENRILEAFSNAKILIENRCGSIYHGGHFIVSRIEDIYHLCDVIQERNLHLKIALDIPQIFTAHNADNKAESNKLIEKIKQIREYIGGVHLWGKTHSSTGRKIAHCGDLSSYFENNNEIKTLFLKSFQDCFNDGVARKLVLEVNSGNADLLSIIDDLESVGISFL